MPTNEKLKARLGVLREALEWIEDRAAAAVTGHKAALESCRDRARAALFAVRASEADEEG